MSKPRIKRKIQAKENDKKQHSKVTSSSNRVSFLRQVQPKSLSGVLPYAGIANSVTPGAGSTGVYIFSANGCYDPDITSTGHQPRGFDNYMALYDHYLVRKARIIVSMAPGACDMNVGITIRDGTSTEVGQGYLESPNTSWQVLLSSATKPAVMSLDVDIGRWLDRDDIRDNKELQGSTSANPDEEVYFHVFAQAQDSVSTPGVIYFTTKILYYVTFREPTQPSVS